MVSRDGRVAGFAEAVPFPIEATDKDCKLSVVRQTPLAELCSVRASGFTPYEMLTVTGHVGGDRLRAQPNGRRWKAPGKPMIGTKPHGQDSLASATDSKSAARRAPCRSELSLGRGYAKQQ